MKTNELVWISPGGLCYVISWFMLGFGVLMAGREGIKWSLDYWRKKSESL